MKRLVVVADDLGRSASVNEAVAEAHDRGILTSASLMAGGEAFEEAAAIALDRPGLSVGLHATLCDGRAVLPPGSIPGLVDAQGRFESDPARAGFRYARRRREVLPQIEAEIRAQFQRLADAGLRPSHVDGHHHLHVHPLLFPVICREASRRGARWVRIPSGDLRDGSPGEWALFRILGALNRRAAARRGMMAARRVHGLTRTGRVHEAYLVSLLPRIREGWNELFVHPDLATETGRKELGALTSPRVRDAIEAAGITLVPHEEPRGERA